MDTVISDMKILRGCGIGDEAVMGKTVIAKPLRNCCCATFEEFLESCEKAKEKIDEVLYFTSGKIPAYLEKDIRRVEKIIISGKFRFLVKTLIFASTDINSSLEEIAVKYRDERFFESCRTVSHMLFPMNTGGIDTDGKILICRDGFDILDAFEFKKSGLLGVVTGEKTGRISKEFLSFLEIPAVEVGEENTFKCENGEMAVLSPKQNAVYLSPSVDVVCDFTEELQSKNNLFAKKNIYPLCTSNKRIYGAVFDIGKEEFGEDFLLEEYSYIGEQESTEFLAVTVREGWESRERIKEAVKSAMRGGVYGEIGIAFSVRDSEDFKNILKTVKDAGEELFDERREFESNIPLGVLIDNISCAFLADKVSQLADFVLIDTDFIKKGSSKESYLIAAEKFLQYVVSNLQKKIKKVGIMGDISKISEKITSVFSKSGNKSREYFLIDTEK